MRCASEFETGPEEEKRRNLPKDFRMPHTSLNGKQCPHPYEAGRIN